MSISASVRLLAEELEVDLDLPALEVNDAHSVAHERHEQVLPAVSTDDFEDLARRQRQQPPHRPHLAPRVVHGAALEILGPPFVGPEFRSALAPGQQLLSTEGDRVIAALAALEPHNRSEVGSGAALDPEPAAGDFDDCADGQ
jgi:hypothetical protein